MYRALTEVNYFEVFFLITGLLQIRPVSFVCFLSICFFNYWLIYFTGFPTSCVVVPLWFFFKKDWFFLAGVSRIRAESLCLFLEQFFFIFANFFLVRQRKKIYLLPVSPSYVQCRCTSITTGLISDVILLDPTGTGHLLSGMLTSAIEPVVMCVYMCKVMYVCMYVCTHIHTHTQTHTISIHTYICNHIICLG